MVENINFDEIEENNYCLQETNKTNEINNVDINGHIIDSEIFKEGETALVLFDFIGEENINDIQKLIILKENNGKYNEVFNLQDVDTDYSTRLGLGNYIIKSPELGEESLIIDDIKDIYKVVANYIDNIVVIDKINDID